MEDNKKDSFYNFLLANSSNENKKPEQKKVKGVHVFMYIVIIPLINSILLWLGWNHAIVYVFHVSTITFVQTLLLYAVVKILFGRGFFSIL
jgi:polyferredoxin